MKVHVEFDELKDGINTFGIDEEASVDVEEVVLLAMKAARLAFEEVVATLHENCNAELDLKARLISSDFRSIMFEAEFKDYWTTGKALERGEKNDYEID